MRGTLFPHRRTVPDHQASLMEYLSGLARVNPDLAENFARYEDWQALARKMMIHEREDFLRQMPRDLLLSIASGDVDPAAAADEALRLAMSGRQASGA